MFPISPIKFPSQLHFCPTFIVQSWIAFTHTSGNWEAFNFYMYINVFINRSATRLPFEGSFLNFKIPSVRYNPPQLLNMMHNWKHVQIVILTKSLLDSWKTYINQMGWCCKYKKISFLFIFVNVQPLLIQCVGSPTSKISIQLWYLDCYKKKVLKELYLKLRFKFSLFRV